MQFSQTLSYLELWSLLDFDEIWYTTSHLERDDNNVSKYEMF